MKICSAKALKAAAMTFIALCLVACNGQGLGPSAGSSGVAVSDSGAVVQTVSDAGGAINEADDFMPESVKAIKAPDKEDYPGWNDPGVYGAEPLTKLFIDSLLYAYSTGDTSLYDELYSPDECEHCELISNEIKDFNSRNVYFDHGLPQELNSVEYSDFNEETKTFTFTANFKLPAHKKYVNGKVDKEYETREFKFFLYLHNPGDQWIVKDFEYGIIV